MKAVKDPKIKTLIYIWNNWVCSKVRELTPALASGSTGRHGIRDEAMEELVRTLPSESVQDC